VPVPSSSPHHTPTPEMTSIESPFMSAMSADAYAGFVPRPPAAGGGADLQG
jgi:hypothetical protein